MANESINLFFEHPVINSPYDYPGKHWELDAAGQPTHEIQNFRRRASFVTPIPKPKNMLERFRNELKVRGEFEKAEKSPTSFSRERDTLAIGCRVCWAKNTH